MQVAEGLVGLVLIGVVAYDVFQSVVLPRPSVGRIRFSVHLVRALWWISSRAASTIRPPSRRESALAAFAPAVVLFLLFAWVLGLVLGYGLIFYSLGSQIQASNEGFGGALYLSAFALFTLGFGGVAPTGTLARAVAVSEAAVGIGMIALVISLLFSLFSAFQRREALVVTLDASAGAPPSGIALLENFARYGMTERLASAFEEWKHWSADTLESHLAYPILVYFRSSHDNEAWINSFGAVMDAAALVISTIQSPAEGPARLFFKVGIHLVEDLSWYFHLRQAGDTGVDREEFDTARERLGELGYSLRDEQLAWEEFSDFRRRYAPALQHLGAILRVPSAPWLGDRSYLPHLDDGRRRAPVRTRRSPRQR